MRCDDAYVNVSKRTMDDMTWPTYVRATTSHSDAEIGRRIGITGASVGRWFTLGSLPSPANAAAFARSYGRPVLEALIAAGFLSSDEAGERPSAPPSLAKLSDDELLDEVRRRMTGGSSWSGTPRPEDPKPPRRPKTMQEYKRERLLADAQEVDAAAYDGGDPDEE